MKKRWLGVAAITLVLTIFFVFWLPGRYVVPVIMYHSIDIAETERARANSVSPRSFELQMKFLSDHHYRVLSVDEYVDLRRSGRKFPAKSVVITFDDGLGDNYDQAYPILKKYGMPATMFVPVAEVGRVHGRWDVPQMTWDQLREMAAHGITIGSHTMTHAYLPDMGLDAARREIVDSKAMLEKELGRRVDYLAYPTGGFSKEIMSLVVEAGYKAAFSTNRGCDRRTRDLFELKRIRFQDTDGAVEMWVKLSGYYNFFRQSRKSN